MPPEDLQFESDALQAGPASRPTSAITGLVIRLGLAREEGQARKVLLIIALVAVAAAVFVQFSFGSSGTHLPPAKVNMGGGAVTP